MRDGVEGLVTAAASESGNVKKQSKLKSFRRSARLVAAGTLAFTAASGTQSTALAEPKDPHNGKQEATAATFNFDIPEGQLADVLTQFRKVSGVGTSIHLPPEQIAGFHSKGVKGAMTFDVALKAILDGTGLGYQMDRGGTRADIQVQNAEQVSVTTSTNSVAMGQFTESLTDTAQTISVVPQYILQEQATTTLRDGLRNVPGISLAAGEGGSQGDNLTIRGFTARNDIYLDGIRDFGSYYRDAFDFEAINVLEGPASVEFGRGSTGGVVNQEMKQAVSNKFVRTNFLFGTDAMRRGSVDVNLPMTGLIPNAAFRLNAMGQDQGVAERNVTNVRRLGVAPSLAFGLGTATRYTINYVHEYETDIPDYGLPYNGLGVAAVPRANYYGFAHGNSLITQPDILTGRFEHDVNSHLTIRNTLRWGYYPRNILITEPQINTTATVTGVGTPISTLTGTVNGTAVTPVYASYVATCNPNAAAVASQCYPIGTPLSQISVLRNQIQATSVEDILWDRMEAIGHLRVHGIDNDFTVAVEGGRERSNPLRSKYAFAPAQQYTSALNPTPNDAFTPTSVTFNGFTHVATQSYGVNFLDTLKVTRWLMFSGGIRFDYFNANSAAAAIPATSTAAVTLSRLDKQPTYRAAVVVKPARNGSVYFDYGTSFNPAAESLSLAANTATSPPEENTTYEVGTKWDLLKDKLNLNGSIFRTQKLNARETDPTNSLNSLLVGTQLVRGVQIGAVGHLPQHFDLIAGYAYLDGRVLGSALNASPYATTNANFYNSWLLALQTNPNAKLDPRYNTAPYFISPNNFPFANVPKNGGNFWLTHSLPWRFVGGFGGNYVSARRASSTAMYGQYNSSAATLLSAVAFAPKAIPGYTVLNAMLRRPINEHMDLQVNVNNLTNKFYIDTPHPNHLIPGEGINAQFGFNARF